MDYLAVAHTSQGHEREHNELRLLERMVAIPSISKIHVAGSGTLVEVAVIGLATVA